MSLTMFKFWHLLARLGLFRYHGIEGMHPKWWPMARVHYGGPYPDGRYSRPMPIGNACDYAEIFNGTVQMLLPPRSPTA